MTEEFPVAFGRYQLNERLASGGMAELFKAQVSGAHGFQKQVVIKRILPHLTDDEHYNRMFIDEAKITARLSHPKIAQTLELGKFNGQLYIAMEFVDGLDLLAILRESAHRRTRVAPQLSVYMIQEMLDGLEYAHQQTDTDGSPLNIVHRDISPSNVLVSVRGDVKLVDFGIAQATEREQDTKAGTLKGKYGYMSPEQVVGAEVDFRSDLFSTGIVLTEMLMGRRLFTAPNDLDVLLMVRDVDLSRFERHGRFLDESLQTIVLKSLHKDPESRFQTAGEFREALAQWLFDQRQRVSSREIAALVRDLYDDAWKRRRQKAAEQAKAASERADAVSATAKLAAVNAKAPNAAGRAKDHKGLPGVAGPSEPIALGADDAPLEERDPPVPGQVVADGDSHESDQAPVGMLGANLGDELDAAFADISSEREGQLAPMESSEPHASGQARGGTARVAPESATPVVADDEADIAFSDGSQLPVSLDDLEITDMSPASDTGQRLTSEIAFDDIASAVRGSGPAEFPVPTTAQIKDARERIPATVSPIEDPPDNTGNLANTSPLKVLTRLTATRATGLLTVTVGGIRKDIYFSDGRPEFVTSNVAGELFGEYLVSEKVISDGELSMALAMMPHYGGKLGDTLVGLGLIKPLDVFRHLTRQVRAKLVNVCTWIKGEFSWFEGRANTHEAFPLDLDCYDAVGAGAMKLRESFVRDWAEARQSVHLASVKSRELRPESFRLGAEVRAIYNKLNGRRSLGELAKSYDSDEHLLRFLRICYLLHETELAKADS